MADNNLRFIRMLQEATDFDYVQFNVNDVSSMLDDTLIKHLQCTLVTVTAQLFSVFEKKHNTSLRSKGWTQLLFFQAIFCQFRQLISEFGLNPILREGQSGDELGEFHKHASIFYDRHNKFIAATNTHLFRGATEIPIWHTFELFLTLYRDHINALVVDGQLDCEKAISIEKKMLVNMTYKASLKEEHLALRNYKKNNKTIYIDPSKICHMLFGNMVLDYDFVFPYVAEKKTTPRAKKRKIDEATPDVVRPQDKKDLAWANRQLFIVDSMLQNYAKLELKENSEKTNVKHVSDLISCIVQLESLKDFVTDLYQAVEISDNKDILHELCCEILPLTFDIRGLYGEQIKNQDATYACEAALEPVTVQALMAHERKKKGKKNTPRLMMRFNMLISMVKY